MSSTIQPSFEDFWNAYDYKKGKTYALAAWKRLSKADQRAAYDRIPAYLEDCELCHREQKYPQGYLNGRLWEDETKKERDERKAAKAATEHTEKTEAAETSIDWMGFRINSGISEGEHARFKELVEALKRNWSVHTNCAGEFFQIVNSLRLDGINDSRRVIRLARADNEVFNREFTVPWYWNPADFERLIARYFNGYGWVEP